MANKITGAVKRTKDYLSYRQEWKFLNSFYEKYQAYTMIPRHLYRANLQLVQKYQHIEGAIVECGTWKGGMIAGMAELLGSDRSYYLFDSFEGLPEVKEIDGQKAKNWQSDTESEDYFDNCTADIKDAEKSMALSKAKNVTIKKGWFSDTLPHYDGGPIAILRLDGDWYDSTMQCFDYLYKHVVDGGIIILDDYYHWSGCSRALHDFLHKTQSTSRIYQYQDSIIAYVIKNETDR